MRSLSRKEVRAADRCAIERVGVPGAVLMENAGRNAADAIAEFLGGAGGKSVAVVAGGGNNGGDGFVIARHLSMRGARVTTFLAAPADKVAGEALVNLEILRKTGCDVQEVAGEALAGLGEKLAPFDVVVDAIGGTGISGELRGDAAVAVEQVNAAGRRVVAVDIPTGLDCDTGQAAGPTVRADMTVTFAAQKRGFEADSASNYTGRVVLADIGVDLETVLGLMPRGLTECPEAQLRKEAELRTDVNSTLS